MSFLLSHFLLVWKLCVCVCIMCTSMWVWKQEVDWYLPSYFSTLFFWNKIFMNKYVTKLAGCCAPEICLYPPSALSTGFSVQVNVDVRNNNSRPYLIKLWGHNFCPIQVWPPVLNMPDKRTKLKLKTVKDFFFNVVVLGRGINRPAYPSCLS